MGGCSARRGLVAMSVVFAMLTPTLAGASVAARPQRNPVNAFRTASNRVDIAVEHWQKGQYAKARALLHEFQSPGHPTVDAATLEVALRYLADCALLDKSLDRSKRLKLATDALAQLMAHDPRWSPPPAVHSAEFYQLAKEARARQEAQHATSCVAERQACSAELAQLSHERGQLLIERKQLHEALGDQIIVVEDRVARNRAVALLPGGIGHFYNGRRKLGIGFLSAELALGASALGLMLVRVYGLGCRRTKGFAPGSLRCDVAEDKAQLTRRVRNAEQIMGLLFFGSLLADVVVAQITFKAHTLYRRRQRRSRSGLQIGVSPSGLSLTRTF